MVGEAGASVDRADVHDCARHALVDEGGDGGRAAPDVPEAVDVEHFAHGVFVELVQRGALGDPGVVDPTGERRPDTSGSGSTLVRRAIGGVSEHDLGHDAVFERAGARGTLEPDHDPAVGGETFRDGTADALAAAGHDDAAVHDAAVHRAARGVWHLSPSRMGRRWDRARSRGPRHPSAAPGPRTTDRRG